MKAYMINLDRRPDRLAFFTEQAERLGLPFQRVAAVDGNDPVLQARAAQTPRGVLQDRIGAYALACFESHRKVWQMFLASNESHCLILEDDVVLAKDLPHLLGGDWIPPDTDLVRLEAYPAPAKFDLRPTTTVLGRALHRMRSGMLGTGAYAISRAMAERMLVESQEIRDPIDITLFNDKSPGFARSVIYQMIPAPAAQGSKVLTHRGAAWVQSSLESERIEIATERAKPRHPTLYRLRRRYLPVLLRLTGRLKGILHVKVPFA